MIWEGRFRNIKNDAIYVVLEKNGIDTKKELTFTDDPIEISYKSDENIYKPIKASTATISILTDGLDKDLYAISDREVKVTIYDSTHNIVIWKGYLTPNIYSQDYDEVKTELELECQDELSTLKSINASELGYDVLSLQEILEKVLGVDADKIIYHLDGVENKYEDTEGNRDIFTQIKLNTALFHYLEDDEDNTYYDVVENIMTFLNMSIYQEKDEFHVVQYDYSGFDTIDLSNDNSDCKINKTSSYKSFTYTHKPTVKNKEWDMMKCVEGNEEVSRDLVTSHITYKNVFDMQVPYYTNPHEDRIRTNGTYISSKYAPYLYTVNRLKHKGTTDGWLWESDVYHANDFIHKNKLPKNLKFYTHKPPYYEGTTLHMSNYTNPTFKKTLAIDERWGYWKYLASMGADFVAIGEEKGDLKTGLLIHQPIQDGARTSYSGYIDFMHFIQGGVSDTYDKDWGTSANRVTTPTKWNERVEKDICAPLMTIESDFYIDEYSQYLGFEIEGTCIFNPEMFINSRKDMTIEGSEGEYPVEQIPQFDDDNNITYLDILRLPIELECNNYRWSREVNGWAKKSEHPYKTGDTFVVTLRIGKVKKQEGGLFSSWTFRTQKLYDTQGATAKTVSSSELNGGLFQYIPNEDGFKDFEDTFLLSMNRPDDMEGKLKMTIFSIPPLELYDSFGNRHADMNYKFVAAWLQGFFITKFKVSEHQTYEAYYEKIFDEDIDEDNETVITLNSRASEEFDDIECSIGNMNTNIQLLSRPLSVTPIVYEILGNKYTLYINNDTGVRVEGQDLKMEEFTQQNIQNQYKDSNLILDLDTHTKGNYTAMSHNYTYNSQFDGKLFVANEISYNLKSGKTSLNLQEKQLFLNSRPAKARENREVADPETCFETFELNAD